MLHLVKPLTLLLLFVSAAAAQNTITGKVTDADDQKPLPGAYVFIPDLKKMSVTDLEGNYQIQDLPKGKFLVEFKFIGYNTIIETITVDGFTEANVSLTGSVTELQELVVTGISHSSELHTNPIPVVTIDQQFLTESSSTNLIESISMKNGIAAISTGVAISKPVIRGLGYNRVITLFDGVRQEGQQWGDEHGIEIDEFSVERIEIVKGAGSLMYGSDGLGGVINFLPSAPVPQGTVQSKLISNYQSNHGLFANSLQIAGNSKNFQWQFRASNKTAKPYQNKFDGRVFNSGFREANVNGTLGISKRWGYSYLNASLFNQTLGLTEGDRDSLGNFIYEKIIADTVGVVSATHSELKSYDLFIPNQKIFHFRLASGSNFYFGNTRLQTALAYQRNQRKEYGDVAEPKTEELFFDLNSATYNFIYFLREKKNWQVSVGSGGMWQKNENKGVEFLIPQ
ncbi:MAG: carboxypeptidase-like regulatory domain-containing protein, partial [Flammeovirgaceae bacterium]|nr:carboxypeptidase-like regulatory domain-containing protein [Flammeovirgaceae bacterium]